ncbi:MAG: L,D-transpeptidase [Butyrivibrio sp.]|nr:L,D-transpeptidase [Butyrivibrio sp.]
MKDKIPRGNRKLNEREAEVTARMNARKAKLIGRVAALNVVSLLAIYMLIGLAYYFGDGFRCRTKINGVSCKGKSVEEVNSELCGKIEYKGIEIKDLNGSDLFVNAEDIGFKVDYTDAINEVVSKQNAFAWGKYAIKGMEVSIDPAISYDKDSLDQIIACWDIFAPDESQDVTIVKTEEGYEIQNTLLSRPEKDNIVNAVGDATSKMAGEIDLSTEEYADCYSPATLTPEQQEVVDLCTKLQKIYNCGITYQFGSKTIPLKGEVADGFILTCDQLAIEDYDNPGMGRYIAGNIEVTADEGGTVRNIQGFAVSESGDPLISEARLYDFFYQMAKDTNTADLLRRYQNGEDVEIMVRKDRTGITQIFDTNAEYEKLKQSFMEGTFDQEEVRDLTDKKKVDFFNAKSELKGTYIELDISNQHLYYYKDGKVYIDTEIVSGTMVGGHGTPAGLFHVYDKQRNKVLKGEDYACPVKYWMRLTDTGVGIHDAWWQPAFGGDIYKEDGSHGCINCPPYIAEELYEVVSEKTPVIVYYR